MRKRWMFIVPAAVVGFAVFIAIGGAVVRLLWNWLLPPMFGWREITFLQALGLLALTRILFGGFGMRGRPAYRWRGGRWNRMTPEERERFREAMLARCGFDAPADRGADGIL